MLVLTRKIGEGIVIGNDVKITILETRGGTVRIGVDAPKARKIYRQEIYERICEENREALQWDIVDLDALSGSLTRSK
ncbi:MAG: carbon storage regulator CsrA [Deltaproteobacteria bacterium]|nr:carbon storage regulator CsrA [Deltaproteobacteria bacterium]